MKKLNYKIFHITFLLVLSFYCFGVPNYVLGKSTTERIKDKIDDISDRLKKEIDALGNDAKAVQDYLDHYPWKGLIQDQATSGVETLSEVKLNGHNKVAVVEKGETIEGQMTCTLDLKDSSALNIYRVVLGFHGRGPQVAVAATLGAVGGVSHPEFRLTAPMEPGIYELRFRTADNFLESKAINAWYDKHGHEPDSSTTIGLIYVKD
jgi:hypothetical protein